MIDPPPVKVFAFDSIEWDEFVSSSADLPETMKVGVRRKRLAQGEGGYFVHHVSMPPGRAIEPHRHDAHEFIYVLQGSIRLSSGHELGLNDSVVVPANSSYGFTVGSQGVHFLLVRSRPATTQIAD